MSGFWNWNVCGGRGNAKQTVFVPLPGDIVVLTLNPVGSVAHLACSCANKEACSWCQCTNKLKNTRPRHYAAFVAEVRIRRVFLLELSLIVH